MNLFAFRFWWLILLLFFLGLTFFYLLCLNKKETQCEQYKKASAATDSAISNISNCCECEPERAIIDSIPKVPQENCGVHFSGLFMGSSYKSGFTSEIYKVDDCSEYVGSGFYPDNELAFPKAVFSTFDGIAIDKGTRLIIYSQKKYQGKILLDIIGPAVINNIYHKNNIN